MIHLAHNILMLFHKQRAVWRLLLLLSVCELRLQRRAKDKNVTLPLLKWWFRPSLQFFAPRKRQTQTDKRALAARAHMHRESLPQHRTVTIFIPGWQSCSQPVEDGMGRRTGRRNNNRMHFILSFLRSNLESLGRTHRIQIPNEIHTITLPLPAKVNSFCNSV